MKSIIITSLSPDSSASLPKYVESALRPYTKITQVWPIQSRMKRLALIALTFHLDRKKWRDRLERESEHRLRTWLVYSSQLQSNPTVISSDCIMQIGLHFNSYPKDYCGGRYIYLHGTLSMLIGSHYDCQMWMPPNYEVGLWMDAERDVLAQADKVFVGSKFLVDILKNTYSVPEGKIVFAGTGAPPFGEYLPNEKKSDDTLRILFVGKDFERKGGIYLLRAFHEIRKAIPKAKLIIVGPASLPGGVQDGIEFRGRVDDRDEIRRLFLHADVFAFPTLHDSFGFALLEAMYFGIPCIGTKIFAIPEIIDDGVTGLLVEPANSIQLAQSIISILRDPEKRIRFGQAGRHVVEEKFSWNLVGSRIASVCEFSAL